MPEIQERNSWPEWSKHVLKELERLNTNYENLNNKIDSIRTDVHEEIADIRNDITKIKAMQYSLDELKAWKKTYENEAVLKPPILDQIDGLLVFGIGFAAKTDDEIAGHCRAGNRRINSVEQIAVFFDRVMPFHALQHIVRAALCRHMNKGHYLR